MSFYNSTNTHVLATHEQRDGNVRMLLFHVCEDGRHEYVVGSYFTTTVRPIDSEGHTRADYEWTWGHYFSSVVDAVDYWKREVAADLLEGFEIHAAE